MTFRVNDIAGVPFPEHPKILQSLREQVKFSYV